MQWAASEFGLAKPPVKSTILSALRQSDRLRALSADCLERKEFRSSAFLARDTAVAEFVVHAEHEHVPVSSAVIVAYASGIVRELERGESTRLTFARTGWISHFLKRHGFRLKRAHSDADSVDNSELHEQVQELRNIIAQYHPSDVYNMDETAFYYSAVPRRSVCLVKAPALKLNKLRLTVAVAANADGTDKLPLLFLGKPEL